MNKINKITLAVLLSTMVGSVGAMQWEESEESAKIIKTAEEKIAKIQNQAVYDKKLGDKVLTKNQTELIGQIEQNRDQQLQIRQMLKQMNQMQPKNKLAVFSPYMDEVSEHQVQFDASEGEDMFEGLDDFVAGLKSDKAKNEKTNPENSFEEMIQQKNMALDQGIEPFNNALTKLEKELETFKKLGGTEAIKGQYIDLQMGILNSNYSYEATKEQAQKNLLVIQIQEANEVLVSNQKKAEPFLRQYKDVEDEYNRNLYLEGHLKKMTDDSFEVQEKNRLKNQKAKSLLDEASEKVEFDKGKHASNIETFEEYKVKKEAALAQSQEELNLVLQKKAEVEAKKKLTVDYISMCKKKVLQGVNNEPKAQEPKTQEAPKTQQEAGKENKDAFEGLF